MPYLLSVPESAVFGDYLFVNAQGRTECVEFVRQAAGAPHTTQWTRGAKVMDAGIGTIPRGTAIATFDESGKYPTDALGRHAAIYLSHNAAGIVVLDQWNSQGAVKQRTIHLNRPDFPRVDCAKHYYIIE